MIINIKTLNIKFKKSNFKINNLNLYIDKNEIFCLIGESGSGKSLTSLGIMGVIDKTENYISGEINFCGRNLLTLTEEELCKIRGNQIAMIFQDSLAALNPLFTIKHQLMEVLNIHTKLSVEDKVKRIKEVLNLVKLDSSEITLKKYPHELSGGQRQRVVIGMSLLCNPKLLIADEPTTALDVTIQKEILNLFLEIKNKIDTSILFITHDLGVVAEIADRVGVMYSGELIEQGNVFEFFDNPKTKYGKKLLETRV